MKTLKNLIVAALILFLAPLATASVYTGSWNNTTFGSSGPLTIDFTLKKTSVSGKFDLDGSVFGIVDPPAISFKVARKADGSGSFKVTGTAIGDVAGSFTKAGKLTIAITNIPVPSLTAAHINGKFDLKIEKFNGTYEIVTTSTPIKGVLEAHVPKPPTIKLAQKVNVTGSNGETQAKVLTNTAITSVSATSNNPKLKISVLGNNPYRIVVKKLNVTSNVKFTATNADGFKKTKTVKFVKK